MKQNQLSFDSLATVDENLFHAAYPSRRTIEKLVTFKDSVGIQASVATLLIYQNSWKHVSSVILVKKELAILHDKGAQLFNLETHVSQEIVTNMSPLYGCPSKDRFLFTCESQPKIFWWRESEVVTFLGGYEEGSRDGTAIYMRFYAPKGISVEFDNVVYVCDYRVGSVRLITTMQHTAVFLESIGRLITAFSVHEKHQKYDVKSLNEAITLVSECLTVLKDNIAHINSTHKIFQKS